MTMLDFCERCGEPIYKSNKFFLCEACLEQKEMDEIRREKEKKERKDAARISLLSRV